MVSSYRNVSRGEIVLNICFLKGADMQSTSRLLVAIIRLCFDQREWELLNEHILLLTKRRNQLKQVSGAV